MHNPLTDASLVGQYVVLVGILVNLVVQLLNRRRQDVADSLQHKLQDLIEENTRLTHQAKDRAAEAYKEANDINRKIASMRRDPNSRTRATDRGRE